MVALSDIAYRVRALEQRVETRPHEYLTLLPPQLEVAQCDARFRLFRAGNQSMGKSTLACLEAVWWATGEHPYQVTNEPPCSIYIICDSDTQSISIQEKLWELLPKDLITDTEFVPGMGFRGRPHCVRFTNGSLITFKTVKAGSMAIAGATVDLIIFDEPPDQRIYSEAVKRVQAKNGKVLLTMTPINRDCTWLQELVEEQKITDLHYRLEAKNLIPVGHTEPLRTKDGRPMDDAWIAEIESQTISWEIPVIVHGEWDFKIGEVVFHINLDRITNGPVIPNDAKVYLGIDHGSGAAFSSTAALVAVHQEEENPYPTIWVLEEYASDGETTIANDAKNIVNMLRRRGLEWKDLTGVYGDRLWMRATGAVKKSNGQLEREILKQIHSTTKRLYPPMKVPYKTSGSVWVGTRYLNDRNITDTLFIDSHCEHTLECFQKWDGHKDSEWKHMVDAVRYAIDDYVWNRNKQKVKIPTIHNG